MLRYIFKNLKSLLTKQGVISLLLVVNIVVSALVICFSYGLYQNYNVMIEENLGESADTLSILVDTDKVYFSENGIPYTEVTLDMILTFGEMLSENTAENISKINLEYIAKTNLFTDMNHDDDGGYAIFGNTFIIKNGEILPHSYDNYFADEDYRSKEKLAVISSAFFEGEEDSYGQMANFSNINNTNRILSPGTEYIFVNGEQYKIKTVIDGDTNWFFKISLVSAPEDSIIRVTTHNDEAMSLFSIDFSEPVTIQQYDDIKMCIENATGGLAYVQPLEFESTSEIYYYKTIILISIVIAILAAINMAILYRYILEKRSSELAILRICGCSKAKAVMSYLIECMLINAPLFALTQLCYHKLIMPKLSDLFPHMQGAYSFKLYAAIFGIYVVASLVVMLIMIVATIRKHSLVEQKNSSKAKTRFGIMKLFEVVQLTTVVAIVICIVSAILSRYQYYTPFEQYLERKGYLLTVDSNSYYEDDFRAMLPPSAECILNTSSGITDGDIHLNGAGYSDEFINAYKPPMKEGIWLSETTDTFENSGYTPIVIAYCDGMYKVGDIIENDIPLSYDENGNPMDIVHTKYKVIGITEDNVYIPSKYLTRHNKESLKAENHMDMYDFFNDSFDENYYMFVRSSDERACYGLDGIIYGTQFVFCEGMSDEEYKELGETLKKMQNIYSAPLSEVNKNSLEYIYEQMYTLFPIALCIFILTVISAVSINAIYTKRQLRNYAIFYICGARWRTCALKSLKDSAITCAVASALCALILFIGKQSFLKETVISFGIWHAVICVAVIALYLLLSMIMPIAIIGSSQPKDVLKEE